MKTDRNKFIKGCQNIRELTGSGKSKHPATRKPKPSKSFFFGTEFVSSTDRLKQRRAEREAAEAAEVAAKAAKAAKKASSLVTAQAPMEIEDDIPTSHANHGMPTPAASVSPVNVASPSPSATVTSSSVGNRSQAKHAGLQDLYHYYLDITGFEYKIKLARSNFAQNQITTYHLSILESHAIPHTYCTLVRYAPPPPRSILSDASKMSDAKVRNHLLKFLNRPDAEAPKPNTSSQIPRMSNTLPDPNEAARLRALVAPRDEPSVDRSELARLHSVITPASPSPNVPYRTLVCPMHSSFPAAWRAFRHVFRDLTLLSWEERFEHGKTIQKSRAQALNIEPYVYSKPELGMPNGLQPQESGLYHGFPGDNFIAGDAEDGYVRNKFNLPDTEVPLEQYGIVGAAIWRDEEKVRRQEQARLEEEEEKEKKERKEREAMRTKRAAEHRRPLFNGLMGRPQEYDVAQGRNSGGHGGAGAVRVRRNRPFPSEMHGGW